MDEKQEPPKAPIRRKQPSPYWWLLMFPIGGIAGNLAADYGPLPAVVGAIFMLLLFKFMQPKR